MGGNDGERANSYPIYQDFQQRAEAFSEVFCQKIDGGRDHASTVRLNWSQRKWCRATTLPHWE